MLAKKGLFYSGSWETWEDGGLMSQRHLPHVGKLQGFKGEGMGEWRVGELRARETGAPVVSPLST